jgi:signal transduction histidine kinase
VMIVQAGAARQVIASAPEDTERALLAVEASGRTAMAELRSLLGLLCPGQDEQAGRNGLRPQPGLAGVRALADRVSAAGLTVRLTVTGTPRDLPPGLDLAAYRVVQEGLTNVLRHAGEAGVDVLIEWDTELAITVSNDRRAPADGILRGPADGTGPGRGLAGLRERVSIYGGTLEAGPRRPGNGWRLRAVIPLPGVTDELCPVPSSPAALPVLAARLPPRSSSRCTYSQQN